MPFLRWAVAGCGTVDTEGDSPGIVGHLVLSPCPLNRDHPIFVWQGRLVTTHQPSFHSKIPEEESLSDSCLSAEPATVASKSVRATCLAWRVRVQKRKSPTFFLWWFKGATFGREIDVTSEIWERKEASTEKSLDGRQYLGALLNASCNCFFFYFETRGGLPA
jgi:hypothetical protein